MPLERVVIINENTTSYTTGSDTTALYVECIGGGGGGGGASVNGTSAGGGGGAYSALAIPSPTASYSCSVGAGGAGGLGLVLSLDANTGSVGVDTYFDSESVCLAKGGFGGQGAASPKGGAGGTIVDGIGDFKLDGASGTVGFRYQDENTHNQFQSGDGARGFFGGGAPGINSRIVDHVLARSGSLHGSGGSGANSGRGGPGSSGVIRIWEYS